MMDSKKLHVVRKQLLALTTVLGVMSLAVISVSLEGRLLPQHLQRTNTWVTITYEDLAEGAVVQPHINTIIHIPTSIDRITRRTLFGRVGTRIRYWGYCFPQTYEEAQELKRRGFPGTLFLSEKEREVRRQEIFVNRKRSIQSYTKLDVAALNNDLPRTYGAIRHQKEIFVGGEVCYIMTEEPLAVGTDEDSDGVNIMVENDHSSDPKKADTDGDGIADGLEIFYLGTVATRRDTDGDGLIDGIEDANRNGRVNAGESDPTKWDTDSDGLCDGICHIKEGPRKGFSAPVGYEFKGDDVIAGEDLDLSGTLDAGETDPTKADTDGDGIMDDQEYYVCYLLDTDEDDFDYDTSDCI